MSRKFYFSFFAAALLLAAALALAVGTSRGAAQSGSAALALPASDFVIVVDARRALNEAVPNLLAGSPEFLAKINTEIAEFQRKTGIDPRSIETIAVGGRLRSRAGRHDDDGVFIMRGSFNSDQLLNAAIEHAQTQSKEPVRKEEQQYEGKRVLLISSARDSNKPLSDKFAVAIIDSNTLAAGDLDGVRAAVDASLGRNRVDDELVRLATQSPGAIVGFSGRVPQGENVKIAPGGGDMPGAKFFASIREFYGSFSAVGGDADVLVNLRTETADQAGEIGQMINAFKGFAGIGFTRSSGRGEQAGQAIADIVKNLSITTQGNEVRIELKVPQSTLGAFMKFH